MPEIPLSLYTPAVLTGVVEKLTQPVDFTWLGNVPTSPSPFPNAAWDVIRGSRMVAKPNTPNAEAHIVPRMGRSRETASFIYTREKKVLEPTTLYWLRQVGSMTNKETAEKAVLREVTDLNQRVDNLIEWCLWQALSGKITLNTVDVAAVIDYKMPSSHQITTTKGWNRDAASPAAPADIIADVTAAKRLVSRDGKVKAKDAYCEPEVLDAIFAAFAANSASLLSDRAKDQYYATGTLPGFLQLDWHPVDETYDAEGGDLDDPTSYIPSGTVMLGDYKTNRPIELMWGPSADDDAPQGHTGKFSKSWKDQDPSARQVLIEANFLPIVTRPEQMVNMKVNKA